MEELHANERGGKGREAARQLAEAEQQALCPFRPNLTKPRVQGLETPALLCEKVVRKGTTKSPEEARRDKLQRLQVGCKTLSPSCKTLKLSCETLRPSRKIPRPSYRVPWPLELYVILFAPKITGVSPSAYTSVGSPAVLESDAIKCQNSGYQGLEILAAEPCLPKAVFVRIVVHAVNVAPSHQIHYS